MWVNSIGQFCVKDVKVIKVRHIFSKLKCDFFQLYLWPRFLAYLVQKRNNLFLRELAENQCNIIRKQTFLLGRDHSSIHVCFQQMSVWVTPLTSHRFYSRFLIAQVDYYIWLNAILRYFSYIWLHAILKYLMFLLP